MAWRGLHISRAASLSLDKGRIRVCDLEGDAAAEPLFFPLEDAAWIILDTNKATLSARLIAACMEAGTPIVFSDQRHHPCGLALSFHTYHAQAEVARQQLALSKPFKKRCWKNIVKAKIRNQAENLHLMQHGDETVLSAMASRVQSGDPKNVEARAARYYWSRIFDGFQRSDDGDLRNALLERVRS